MTIKEWREDFKSFINELDIPKDDYNGIMEYIDDGYALLKEQEPMKPTWSQGKAYCGNCSQKLPRKREDKEINYCGCCGQEVKWK